MRFHLLRQNSNFTMVILCLYLNNNEYCNIVGILGPLSFIVVGFILEGLDLIERLGTSVTFGWGFVPQHKKVE